MVGRSLPVESEAVMDYHKKKQRKLSRQEPEDFDIERENLMFSKKKEGSIRENQK